MKMEDIKMDLNTSTLADNVDVNKDYTDVEPQQETVEQDYSYIPTDPIKFDGALEQYTQQEVGPEADVFDAAYAAFKTNWAFSYNNDNPKSYDKNWTNEQKMEEYNLIKEEHGKTFADDWWNEVYDKNELYASRTKEIMLEDLDYQKQVIEGAGHVGGFFLNATAAITAPQDIVLGIATLGYSKIFKIGQSLDKAYELNKISKSNYLQSKALLGAAEGSVLGFSSEGIRQESSGFQNTEDLLGTALFGSVFGTGARLMTRHTRMSQEAVDRLSPNDKKKYYENEEQEIIKYEEARNKINEEKIAKEKIIEEDRELMSAKGLETNIERITEDEIAHMSDTIKYGTFNSPLKNAYSYASTGYQSVLRKLASPYAVMRNAKNEVVSFTNKTALDIKYGHQAKIDFTIRKQGVAWNKYNEELIKNGQDKISYADFNKMVTREKRRIDQPLIEVEETISKIDTKLTERNEELLSLYKKNKKTFDKLGIRIKQYDIDFLFDKKSTIDFKNKQDEVFNTFKSEQDKLLKQKKIEQQKQQAENNIQAVKKLEKEMYQIKEAIKDRRNNLKKEVKLVESLNKISNKKEKLNNLRVENNNKLNALIKNKEKSNNTHIQSAIDAFEDVMDEFNEIHYKIQDKKKIQLLDKKLEEVEEKYNNISDKIDNTSNKTKKSNLQKELNNVSDELNDLFRQKIEISLRSTKPKTKTYIPAVYKREEIVNNETKYKQGIVEALEKQGKTNDEAVKAADEWINNLISAEFSGDLQTKFKGKKGKYDPLNGIFNTSRTLDINRKTLSDMNLMEDNMFELLNRYSQTMTGKMALRENLGISTRDELEDLYVQWSKEMRDEGFTQKEIEKANNELNKIYDIVSGDYGVVKDPNSTMNKVKRTLMPISNITYGLNFGLTSLAEAGNIIGKYGIRAFMKHAMNSFRNTTRKYKNKMSEDPIYEQLELMGVGSNMLNNRIMSRFNEGDEIYYSRSKYLDMLKYAEGKVFNGGGLIFVTESFRDISANCFIGLMRDSGKKLLNGKKLSKQIENDMARFGITPDDLKIIGQHKFKYDNKGNITDLQLDNLPKDVKERFEIAINRSTKGSVLEPNSLDLPTFMTDPNQPIGQLITQFLRFPIDAHNKLLASGIDEGNVSTIAAIMYSSFISGMILAAREEVLVQANVLDRKKMKYDITSEEGQTELFKGTLNKTPHFGAFITVFNKVAPFAGVKPLLADFHPNPWANLAGPGLGKIEVTGQSIGDLFTNPGELTNKQRHFISSNSIITSLPFVGDIAKSELRNKD